MNAPLFPAGRLKQRFNRELEHFFRLPLLRCIPATLARGWQSERWRRQQAILAAAGKLTSDPLARFALRRMLLECDKIISPDFLATSKEDATGRVKQTPFALNPDECKRLCISEDLIMRLAEQLLLLQQFSSAACIVALTPSAQRRAERFGIVARALSELKERRAAEWCLRRAAKMFPCSAELQRIFGDFLLANAQRTQARMAYSRSLELNPGQPDVSYRLGVLLLEIGHLPAAERALHRAMLEPRTAPRARLALALLYRAEGRIRKAINHCIGALTAPRLQVRGNALLSDLYGRLGRLAQARDASHKALVAAQRPQGHKRGDHRPRVAVLCGLGKGFVQVDQSGTPFVSGGHNNFLQLLDSRLFSYFSLWPGVSDDRTIIQELRSADLILNTMAEPDGQLLDLLAAERNLSSLKIPIINDPRAIRIATRDVVAKLVQGIDGLIAPRTIRFESGNDFESASGMRLPILCRPFGSHGGEELIKANTFSEVRTWLRKSNGGYLSEYFDLADSEGFYRKARVYCVGGTSYPEHYYVCDHWNVHAKESLRFFKRHPEVRDEARHFLRHFDSNGSIGRALRQLSGMINVDVFIADLGFKAGSPPVLFEANASAAAIVNNDLSAEGDHVADAITRIRRAFNEHLEASLLSRATCSLVNSCQLDDFTGRCC